MGPSVDRYFRRLQLVPAARAGQGWHQILRATGACCHGSEPSPCPTLTQQRGQQCCSRLLICTEHVQDVQVSSRENCFLILRNVLTLLFIPLSSFLKIHEIRRLSCVPELQSNTTLHFYSRNLRGKLVEFCLLIESDARL